VRTMGQPTIRDFVMKSIALLSAFFISQFAFADDPSWSAPHAPFQITDHIYSVGTEGIGVYLITTPEGHILIDASTQAGADVVEANIKSLGFKLGDIKYLLENHAHNDHVGGLAQLKKSTGAILLASKGDSYALEHGKNDWDNPNGEYTFPAVKVDKIIADGERVRLGGMSLQAMFTPGHTKGCTSWITRDTLKGVDHSVFFLGSLSVADNRLINNKVEPTIVADYRNSFARAKAIQADILLIGHPPYLEENEKDITRKEDQPETFIDPTLLPRFVARFETSFEKALKEQQEQQKPSR